MIGKRVQFDEETWAAINLLRQERRRSFQQLAEEAFADLLEKHHRPVDLKSQLRESLGEQASKPARKKEKLSPWRAAKPSTALQYRSAFRAASAPDLAP